MGPGPCDQSGQRQEDAEGLTLKPSDPLLEPEGQTLLGGVRADLEWTHCP